MTLGAAQRLVLFPSLGPELVTNGRFEGIATGWTESATCELTSVDGRGRVTNSGTGEAYAFQTFTIVAGRQYRVRCDMVNAGAGVPSIRIGTAEAGLQYLNITAGVGLTRYFRATEATFYITIKNNDNTDTFFSDFDNISVRQVLGQHGV